MNNDMTDKKANENLPTPVEASQASGGWWQKTAEFLNRDVKTFFNSDGAKDALNEEVQEDMEPEEQPAAEAAVPSLVDENKLPGLVFKREVLDWRDNFHADMFVILNELQATFIRHVEDELRAVNVFRKLLARPSDEVLQDGFVRLVRIPLTIALRDQEALLNASAAKRGMFGKVDLSFDLAALSGECDSLKGLAFRSSNKKTIDERVHILMHGPAGLAANFYDQGFHLSRKYINAHNYDKQYSI